MLRPDISFDVVDRNLMIGGRDACLYCIDGFTKDDTLLKVLQAMSSIETAQMPDNANDFAALYLAYGEIGLETDLGRADYPASLRCSFSSDRRVCTGTHNRLPHLSRPRSQRT